MDESEQPSFTENTRAPLKVPVKIRFTGSDRLVSGFSANVSQTGMFVVMEDPEPVGSLLQFELVLDEIQSVRGFAEVVWIRLLAESIERPRGMGVRFRYLAADGRERLRQRLEPLVHK